MDHLELKAMREGLGISQTEMAMRLTMPRNTYLRWESGATKKLPSDLAERLTRVSSGVAVHREAVGEEMVLIIPRTHPQYYDKIRAHGWHAAANHPLGGSGTIKRKHLEIYERDGREAMNAAMALDDPPAPKPPLNNPVDNPPYVHTGEDDAELEKKIQSFFSKPT